VSATAPPTLHILRSTALGARNRTVHVFAVTPYENVVAAWDLRRRDLAEFQRSAQLNVLVGGSKGDVGGGYAVHFSSFTYFESLIKFYTQLAR